MCEIGKSSRDFRESVVERLPNLRAYAMRLCRRSSDADDLVQHTVEAALRNESKFDGANLSAWMTTIMKNRFISSVQADRRRSLMSGRIAASSVGVWSGGPPSSPDSGWSGRDARRALASVSPPYREAMELVDVRELTYSEAAEEMGCPVGTVMSRLHRGRKEAAAALGCNPP